MSQCKVNATIAHTTRTKSHHYMWRAAGLGWMPPSNLSLAVHHLKAKPGVRQLESNWGAAPRALLRSVTDLPHMDLPHMDIPLMHPHRPASHGHIPHIPHRPASYGQVLSGPNATIGGEWDHVHKVLSGASGPTFPPLLYRLHPGYTIESPFQMVEPINRHVHHWYAVRQLESSQRVVVQPPHHNLNSSVPQIDPRSPRSQMYPQPPRLVRNPPD